MNDHYQLSITDGPITSEYFHLHPTSENRILSVNHCATQTVTFDDKTDQWWYRCLHGHTSWEPTNGHFRCATRTRSQRLRSVLVASCPSMRPRQRLITLQPVSWTSSESASRSPVSPTPPAKSFGSSGCTLGRRTVSTTNRLWGEVRLLQSARRRRVVAASDSPLQRWWQIIAIAPQPPRDPRIPGFGPSLIRHGSLLSTIHGL